MRDNQPVTVSVLLPVHNGEKYISKAIDSILSQTFHNFELIVIDDGSSDGTLAILKNYELIDARIHLISRGNKGLIATLNEGIDIACGKWLVRMDADDIALPNRIERLLYWIEQTGVDVAGSWVQFFGSFDRRIWKGYQSDEAIKVDMLFKCPFVHPSVMMRSELAKQLKYDPDCEKAEDYDLWVRAAISGWKMINVPEVLLKYRKHNAQVSITSANKQQLMTEVIRKKYWDHIAKSSNLDLQAVQEVFKLTSISPLPFNIDIADSVLLELLYSYTGESRRVILDNIYRFYLRISSNYSDIGERWDKLNREVGNRPAFFTRLKLWVLHTLKIRQESKVFDYLKKIHIWLISRI
jgi:glycosyltransferase involved in cell wall biosynthesis